MIHALCFDLDGTLGGYAGDLRALRMPSSGELGSPDLDPSAARQRRLGSCSATVR